MKATGIVRRIDDLERMAIPKEIRRTMRSREGVRHKGDVSQSETRRSWHRQLQLTPIDRFCVAIHSVVNRYKETAE